MSAPLDDLIEKLEKATGPDQRLDETIALNAGWREDDGGYGHHNEWFPPKGVTWHEPPFSGSHSLGGYTAPPRYTKSIDTALTLVPEGARVREIGQWDEHGQPSGWFAHVTRYFKTAEHRWECRSFTHGIQDPMDFHPKVPPLAPNGAIALCIAALKSRMTAPPNDAGGPS